MREKTRKIFIMIVMAALIVSLMAASFAALTYGRYSGGRRDENSAYEDILDFVGETAFEVSTADELVNAINNGYSYIKVVGDDPTLVVNNNVADVVVNLVLDVNGHKIVRNSRNPLLNVRQSVSVVLVYDSSEKAEGGFYNPVGSALQTSGGTLTVGEGVYESGPRTGIGLDFSDTVSATVCSRDGRKAASYSVQATAQTFPKLTEKTGDVYLDENYSGTGDYLKADTYLIYTEEKNAFVGDGSGEFKDGQLYVNRKETSSGETTTITADKFSPICNVASCDFYYYYPVSGTAGTADAPQTYAVVYGYNDVKALAKDCTDTSTDLSQNGLVWPYAAIRSEAGNTHARGGEFYTYFGEENTYSIYSEGGTMTVGLSGESDPPKFQAIGKGVCINMAGTSGSADQTLTIENGEFSSKIGDTIKMSGGEMEVKKGSFTKDAAVLGAASGENANNGSAISISGGTLTSSDTEDTSKPIQFHISGSYVNGIYAKGGEVNIANATFVFENGKNNQGVYNDGGTSRAHWCDFTIPGNNNYGIHSTNGTTRASDCNITMTGDYVVGVYTTGGRALVEGGIIDVAFVENKSDGLLTSAAVSTEGGEIYLAGSLTINSASLGVTVRKVDDTEGSLEIADQEIKIENNTYKVAKGDVTINTPNATGIYINNGSLTNKGTVTVKSSVGNQYGTDQGWSWVDENGSAISDFNKYNGVYVQGGSLVSEGELNVTFTGVQNDAYGSGANSNLNANTAYRDFQIKSYAVRVEAAASGGDTKVSIAGGTISNSVGGGVYVGGGKVTLGVENGKGPTVQTTGTSVEAEERDPFGYGGNWVYYLPQTGGPAVKVAGGESTTIYGGTYTAQQGDGIVTVGGTSYIHNGTFIGRDQVANADDRRAGPGASYSFKVYGGTVTVKDGTFGSSTANGGGAFVAGTVQEKVKAQINGGSFLSGGQAAFSILDNATVTFGENNAANITVQGSKAGLVLEGYSGIGSPEITINGGNFSSTSTDENESSAIWSGNPNFKLTINGGKLTGEAKDGIFIARRTWNNESDPFIGTLKITGGEITGKTHGLNLDRDIKSENAVEISGNAVLTGSTGSGLNLAGALYKTHAVVITGGEFKGAYGAYYGKDGGGGDGDNLDRGDHVNDGLLIMGGTFTGNTKGFYFNDNPWSRLWLDDYNNVAIVGGTFGSFGADDNSIKAGDVFTMHVEYNGVKRYGVDEDNGVYGNATAGEGAVVMDLNKQITLTPTTNS